MKDRLRDYRQAAVIKEEQLLHHKAALSKNHDRYSGHEDDHRLPYRRDVDRIVHSKAFARYADKTQVVYLVENDHVTHRGLHVQLVSHFARGVGEILQLNLDLVEAIALGHDVGHPPFGHEGEGYLSDLSEAHGNGKFAHPLQSCRLFSEIEPLNMGLAVYDGFLCHDGGMHSNKLTPRYGKTWQEHFADKSQKLGNPDGDFVPGTLEGCLVKLSDTMSYVGKDIEDAISLGILKREDVPKTILGDNNRAILSRLASDMIEMSYGKDYIAVSEPAFKALKVLRDFNFKNIYTHPKLKKESKRIRQSYKILFQLLLDDLSAQGEESYIWLNYAYNKPSKYLAETKPVQLVIDYISGMTDSYFVRTLENLTVPKRISLV